MRRKLPALLGSVILVLLATLGGVAGAGSLGEGTGLADLSRLVAALTPGSQKLHFSGVLTQNDAPVAKGNQKLRFSLWTDPTSTDPTLKKWQEDQMVAVRNGGVINVFLGSSTPFPEGVFENDSLFLGIDLLDSSDAVVTAFPRQELAHVPKAFRAVGAGKADKLDDEKCAKCVKESHVQDKVIGREKIKDNAVHKEQLGNSAVAREKIEDRAVGREKIEDRAVGREKIEDRAVGREKIEGKAVGRGQLDDKAVGRGQLDDKAVGRGQLDTGAALDALPGYSVFAITGSFALTSHRSVAATIGVDGLPVIAFPTDLGVAVAHCADLACTTAAVNTVDGLTWSGSLAIAIGPDGNPLVGSGSDLATCADLACSTATIDSGSSARSAVAVTAIGEVVSGDDDEAVGVGGHGGTIFIRGGGALEAEICRGPFGGCAVHIVLDAAGADQVSLAINAQGGPIVAYTRGNELRFAQCDDPLCATRTTGLLDTAGSGVIVGPSVAIGRDGRPVIAYTKRTATFGPTQLFVAHCSTPNCSSATVVPAVFTPTTGPMDVDGSASITIGRDGLPLIAFQSLGQLQVLHCGNAFCVPNVRAR